MNVNLQANVATATVGLTRLGISPAGCRQALAGEVVTSIDDRRLIGRLLMETAGSASNAASFALVAARFKNAGGNY